MITISETTHERAFVGSSPIRFELTLSTVSAGESSAESFDRFPPRQLALLIESWR